MIRTGLSILLTILTFSAAAQTSFEKEVCAALAELGVQIFSPIERATYQVKPDRNKFFQTDFILDIDDKVEVRVEYFSWKKDSLAITNPNIKNGIRLGQLMTNIDDSVISLHRLGSEDLIAFGADWATQASFHPKEEFSDKQHCQLLTLYKEEIGLVFVYLLFDNEEKYNDDWRYLIGFQKLESDTLK